MIMKKPCTVAVDGDAGEESLESEGMEGAAS